MSEITVRRMIKNGHLKATRLYETANWRISEEEVERIRRKGMRIEGLSYALPKPRLVFYSAPIHHIGRIFFEKWWGIWMCPECSSKLEVEHKYRVIPVPNLPAHEDVKYSCKCGYIYTELVNWGGID